MRNKGFTLIELLVVIAIIAILAAILFPVFARAREKARTASCQSNLKQIALAVLQYVSDNDQKFPGWRTRCWTGEIDDPWHADVMPYVKNKQIFGCPSARRTAYFWACQSNGFPAAWEVPELSYGINEYMSHSQNDCGCDRAKKEVNWDRPAQTLLVADSKCGMIWGENNMGIIHRVAWPEIDNMGGQWCSVMNTSTLEQLDRYTRHSSGSNIAFLDGHVKWFAVPNMKPTRFGGSIVIHPTVD